MTRRHLFAGAASIGLVLAALTLRPSSSIAIAPVPSDLQAALARDGFDVNQLSMAAPGSTSVSEVQQAIATVTAEFSSPVPPVAYLGRLTVQGSHTGGVDTPLAIEDRPVYGVQLTGQNLMPFGGVDGPVPTSAAHHELIAFVDAQTGKLLVVTTVR